jgi:hypothetical protein
MEHLKSGDVPDLVTNMEVMNILSNRLTIRQEEEEAAATIGTIEHAENTSTSIANGKSNDKNSKLRHRDYIEETVYEYLAHSACANVDLDKIPTLVSKLKGKRKVKKAVVSNQNQSNDVGDNANANIHANANKLVKTEEGAFVPEPVSEPVSMDTNEENDDNDNNSNSSMDQNYGLTDAETLQILNHMPTEPVEVHLMIQDLPSRLNEDEQNNLIELIAEYAGVEAEPEDETEVEE